MPVKVQFFVLEETFESVTRQVKICFDDAAALAVLDAAGVCTLSQQQSDGSKENTFSCSGLTCDNTEAPM